MKIDWIIKISLFIIGILIIQLLVKPKMDNFCVSCKTDADCADGMKCKDGCCVPT